MDFAAIWAEAEAAGQKAIDDFSAKYGTNERAGGYDSGACGFAWVKIRPARGPFVTWCKKQNAAATVAKTAEMGRHYQVTSYGDLAYNGGWEIWSAGSKNYHGQSVDTKEVAARAFAEVLNKHGIKAMVGSRLD